MMKRASGDRRVAIITEQALNWEHGTGAQLLRLFDQPGISFIHFYTLSQGYGPSSCAGSYLLEDPKWPFQRGSGIVRSVRLHLGRSWWDEKEHVNRRRFAALSSQNDFACDLAYVVVGTEWAAARAVSLIEALEKVPYVVHIMDIYDEQGLSPDKMPKMRQLLEGASSVIALTQTIYNEVSRFMVRDACKIPIGQELTSHIAQPLKRGEIARCVLVGRPYPEGAELLADAYTLMSKRSDAASVEFLNLGAHINKLPPQLRAITRDLGQVDDREAYLSLLAQCHIAYLSGPSTLDCFGRFSFPSRSSDYFMSGLPTIGCIAVGTATEQELVSLIPDAVQVVHTAHDLVNAFDLWTNDVNAWHHASKRVRQFAEQHLDIKSVRQQVRQKIESALASSV